EFRARIQPAVEPHARIRYRLSSEQIRRHRRVDDPFVDTDFTLFQEKTARESWSRATACYFGSGQKPTLPCISGRDDLHRPRNDIWRDIYVRNRHWWWSCGCY